MQVSTVVTRTPAGSAELAAPAHGLSLTQRRFLTLLDSACSIEALAARQPGDAEKLQRDLARLASLGLVAFDTPAANDAHAALDTVRLGPPGASSRLPYILAPLVAALLGLVAWHFLASSPAPAPAHSPDTPHAVASPPTPQRAASPADAIATRVLLSDPAPAHPREAVKEPPRAKPVETEPRAAPVDASTPAPLPTLQPIETRLTPQPFVAAPIALPVVRRSPAQELPAPVPGDVAPAKTDGHAMPPPVHVASATPAAAALVRSPPRKLVPIAQEPPSFPREAMAAGLASGNVKARLTIDAKGSVSSVDIVEASHRAFDRAVRDALSRWRFEAGAAGRTTTVDVAFRRD
jgi:protein TonB